MEQNNSIDYLLKKQIKQQKCCKEYNVVKESNTNPEQNQKGKCLLSLLELL